MRRLSKKLADELDATTVVLAIGIALLAIGCWSWWQPGSFLVPGALLVWLALPPRKPFVVSPPVDVRRKP